jgi:hypothetical protein
MMIDDLENRIRNLNDLKFAAFSVDGLYYGPR